MFNPRDWSGSQIRISIRITPNFELVLAMVIASQLIKFHQNPTSTLWETLIRISDFQNPTCSLWETLIRITPNFELCLLMIITSLLTKFHQNPTSSLWEILLTNQQTNKQTNKQTNRQTNKHTKVIAFRGIINSFKTIQMEFNFSCKYSALVTQTHQIKNHLKKLKLLLKENQCW